MKTSELTGKPLFTITITDALGKIKTVATCDGVKLIQGPFLTIIEGLPELPTIPQSNLPSS